MLGMRFYRDLPQPRNAVYLDLGLGQPGYGFVVCSSCLSDNLS
jgi:hypothetical protein